jgi:ribosome-binding protein aMBF1 (putative translation factor)
MAPAPTRWSQIRDKKLRDPTIRERYEQTRRTMASIRQVLQLIDTERRQAGLTKAELATRIGASPAAVRRLFTSGSANPTLRTVLELVDALDLEMSLTPRPRGRAPRSSGSADTGAQPVSAR